jgi:hypothetical protein
VDSENLPAPEVLAQEIVESLDVALEQFESITLSDKHNWNNLRNT